MTGSRAGQHLKAFSSRRLSGNGRGRSNSPGIAGAVFVLFFLVAPLPAQDFDLDWWSIDGGGEMFAEGGEWTLSGSVGQWDVSVDAPQSGGNWELTGGFWGVVAGDSDLVFKDGFES